MKSGLGQYQLQLDLFIYLVLWFLFSTIVFSLRNEVADAEFRFNYYRMWGGDLKRRGHFNKALEAYEKANQAQESDLPARFIPAGDLALKLGDKEKGKKYLVEGARRRLLNLENKISLAFDTETHLRDKNKAWVEVQKQDVGKASLSKTLSILCTRKRSEG